MLSANSVPQSLFDGSILRSQVFYKPPSVNPLDGAMGVYVDCSDRPIMNMSINRNNGEVAVGCTDHSVYCVNVNDRGGNPRVRTFAPRLETGAPKSVMLYGKTFGHSEWVTGVSHIANTNNLVSIGMDSKVCLWKSPGSQNSSSKKGGECLSEYHGVHAGSISKILADNTRSIAITAGYDGKMNVWDFSGSSASTSVNISSRGGSGSIRGSSIRSNIPAPAPIIGSFSTVQTGNPPIMDMWYSSGLLVSGARDGGIVSWDVTTAGSGVEGARNIYTVPLRKIKGHAGSVNVIRVLDSTSDVFVSGGADGIVRLWDFRVNRACISTISAHTEPNAGSKPPPVSTGSRALSGGSTIVPAVSCIESSGSYVVSGGTDSIVCVHDIRFVSASSDDDNSGVQCTTLARWNFHKNGIYSMCKVGDSGVITGDGTGMLHCYDISASSSSTSRQGGRSNNDTGSGLKYGLQACQRGAVHCIGVVPYGNKYSVACAGDDGNILLLDYET